MLATMEGPEDAKLGLHCWIVKGMSAYLRSTAHACMSDRHDCDNKALCTLSHTAFRRPRLGRYVKKSAW